MRHRYLEVTFRDGKPFAAYLYLPRPEGVKVAKTVRAGAGVLVDYAAEGTPIGIEITAPSAAAVDEVNRLLRSLGLEVAGANELAPLQAA